MLKELSSRLTPKQLKLFKIIQSYFSEHQQSPTLKELSVLMQVPSIRSITQFLDKLEQKGLIARSRYQNRSIKLVGGRSPFSETVMLPVVGSAGCDNLSIYAEQQADEFVTVDRSFLQGYDPRQMVIIRAVGSSMTDAGINSGDLILTELTQDVKQGEKVVAIIEHMAVIKKISFTDNAIILNPMSPDPRYRPIIMREDFQIGGRVVDVIRNSKNQSEYVYEEIKE